MADPVYGPGGSGYYTDPATGQRVWQTRTAYGANAYDPQYQSTLVYDPSNVASDGSGTPTTGVPYVPANTQGAPGSGLAGGLTAEQRSAKAILAGTLAQYGLGGLGDRAWNLYLQGEPIEQIMLDLRQTDEYKQRFPAMAQLSQSGHAITESDYINLETEYKQRMRAAGLPPGFYDQPSDFTSYIGLEVSPVELQARLDEYTAITYSLPPIVRDEMTQKYGFTAGDITAYIIDPERALPILHNQVLAAQVGAGSRQAGYGSLLKTEAEQLAQLGVDFNSAVKGFGQLTDSQQLFTPLAGNQGETAIGRDEQLAAQFGGNANAQRRIENRARQRVATFQEGGSVGKGGFGRANS